MTHHGLSTRVFAASPRPIGSELAAARRRFTVSVLLEGGPSVARRLVGWLKWRGFRFDHVVSEAAGEDGAQVRVVLTYTSDAAGGRVLMQTLERYAPVRAVRQFYAPPVVEGSASRGADARRNSLMGPFLASVQPAV